MKMKSRMNYWVLSPETDPLRGVEKQIFDIYQLINEDLKTAKENSKS